MVKRSFPLLGLNCAACAAHSTKALESTPGVQSATVNLASATAFVVYDETQCTPEMLRAAVAAMGYDLRIDEPEPAQMRVTAVRTAEMSDFGSVIGGHIISTITMSERTIATSVLRCRARSSR